MYLHKIDSSSIYTQHKVNYKHVIFVKFHTSWTVNCTRPMSTQLTTCLFTLKCVYASCSTSIIYLHCSVYMKCIFYWCPTSLALLWVTLFLRSCWDFGNTRRKENTFSFIFSLKIYFKSRQCNSVGLNMTKYQMQRALTSTYLKSFSQLTIMVVVLMTNLDI